MVIAVEPCLVLDDGLVGGAIGIIFYQPCTQYEYYFDSQYMVKVKLDMNVYLFEKQKVWYEGN